MLTCWALAALTATAALFARPDLFSMGPTVSLLGGLVALAWLMALACPRLWVAALVRIATVPLFAAAAHPLGTDAGNYLHLAQSQVFSVNGDFATYPPLYPLLLRLSGMLVGFGVAAPWLLNTMLDLGSAITLRRFGPAGKRAAILFLLWPTFVFSAAVPQKESLAILLVLQIGLVFHKGLADRWAPVRVGVATGLLALAQPALASFTAAAGLIYLRQIGWRRMAHVALLSLPCFALIMLPWWLRNFAVFGEFVPLTTSSGLSMMVAVTGSYASLDPFYAMPELAGSRAAAEAALRYWADYPLDALYHRASAYAQSLLIEDWAGVRSQWMGMEGLAPLIVPATQLSYVALLLACARTGRLPTLAWACLLQIVLFALPFEFAERHRYPLIPALLLMAPAGNSSTKGTRTLPTVSKRPGYESD